jgi:hypothetical protein
MKTRILPILLCLMMMLPVTLSVSSAEVEAASSPTNLCQKRVASIHNRGKHLAKGSKTLRAHYKVANKRWKDRLATNKKTLTKYGKEPRLQAQETAFQGSMQGFKTSVKNYNAAKKVYIQERNSQIKSYKHFSANCSTAAGRNAARAKILAWKQDVPKLNKLANSVHAVYTSQVVPANTKMHNDRVALINARATLSRVVAQPAAVQDQSVTPEDVAVGEEADETFDASEIDDPAIETDEALPGDDL